jgi:hypothetical protein
MAKSTYFRSSDSHPVDWHPDANRMPRRRSAWDPWPELIELAVIGTYKGIAKTWGWARRKVRSKAMATESRTLTVIVGLAREQRMALLTYLKPGEDSSSQRLVEPYRLQDSHGNLMVQCWQVDPEIPDRAKWRNFRIDRIRAVSDGGRTFTPRCEVTLCNGEVSAFEWGHDPIQTLGPAAAYMRLIESAMLDGKISEKELAECRAAGVAVPIDERRGAHAQVFSNVLQEVLTDGQVSDREERYLAGVRKFLKSLGWAP